jgi:hypothetical protein
LRILDDLAGFKPLKYQKIPGRWREIKVESSGSEYAEKTV